jgi:uncharacterized membrane-anchored protein YitT (DUF2179 family)
MLEPKKTSRFKRDFQYLIFSIKTWQFWRTILLMAIGSVVIASAVNGLLVNYKLFDGGANGISLIIFYLTGWPPLGAIYFLINVPILIIGWREMSLRFLVTSIIGVIFLSTALYFTRNMSISVKEMIMVPILAGIVIGAGAGVYMRFGGSCGGIEIIAQVLRKKFSIPMGNTYIAINAIPLIGAVIIRDIDIALYTGVFMYVQSYVLQKVQTGFSQRKAIFIVSHQTDVIAEQVMKRLDRGVTFFHASGGWTHEEQRVIYTVINMTELGRLKEMLFLIDPEAFIAISDTAEVIGKRFLTWEDEGFTPVAKSTA